MAFTSWKDNTSGEHEVNLTPLIDVSLVLVVMLMLTSPLAFESSIKVRASQQTAQAAAQDDQDEMIEIFVLADGHVRINRSKVPREQMEMILRPMLEKSVRRRVMIGCDVGVTHGDFVGAMDTAKMCGATDIAVVERQPR